MLSMGKKRMVLYSGGTGIAGTVTFFLCGTGTRMHYGSGSESGFRTEFPASDIDKARFCILKKLLKNSVKYCLVRIKEKGENK